MPTTRRQSQPPDTPSASSPAPNTSTPIQIRHTPQQPTSAARGTRSTSRSRTPLSHHRKSADEIAAEEAAKYHLLPETPVQRLRSTVSGDDVSISGGSARDRRHLKLLEAREEHEPHSDDEEGEEIYHPSVRLGSVTSDTNLSHRPISAHVEDDDDEEEEEEMVEDDRRMAQQTRLKNGRPSHVDIHSTELRNNAGGHPASPSVPSTSTTLDSERRESLISTMDEDLGEEESDEDDVSTPKLPLENSVASERSIEAHGSTRDELTENGHADEHEESDQEPGSEPETDSEEDSDASLDSSDASDSSSEPGETDDSEDSDEEDERLEALLQKAKISAIQKQKGKEVSTEVDEANGETILQFDGAEDRKKEAPIPDIAVPILPRPHLSFNPDGSAKASSSNSALISKPGPSKLKGKEKSTKSAVPELERDDRPYEQELSKRQKAAQPRKATASELWATLPSARSDALPQMKRDYQALALANSLDPKRFMKGSTKLSKVPEVFAIGTLVDPPKHVQDSTLAKDTRYRPGQIVQDLVRDEGTGSLAKRKYGDLQWKRMENGRGRGRKRRSKW